jgi:hypothetical protein
LARVTTVLVLLSFVSTCITFVLGVRVGHGEAALGSHLNWGAVTLVLQLFAAGVSAVHARASGEEIAALRAALEEATAHDDRPRSERP